VAWVASGPARIYSYTVLRKPGPTPADPLRIIVPALVEFPACAGVRFMAPIVDTAVDRIHIGAGLVLGWSNGVDCKLPVFTLE
jgi:uncharacterized OB-fold protein